MASADIAEDGESSKENSKNYDVQSNGKSPHGTVRSFVEN